MAQVMNRHHSLAVQSGLIVIVDDDAAVRKSLKFSLEVEGFVVRTYARGEELLNETAFPTCRCLVIDQKLPGINGIDLIERLRQDKVSAPAILIATHPNAALKARAAGAGVPIVEKPLLGSALLDSIRFAVAGSPAAAGGGSI
jgi:FixJ family two-component response regulator